MTEILEKRAVSTLSAERAEHTMGVVKECLRIGRAFLGEEHMKDLEYAALLHDITKEYTQEEHIEVCRKYSYELSRYDLLAKGVMHSISASLVAKHEYGMSDEICNAVRYHTTGRADMTLYEKILYIADLTEEGRKEKIFRQMRCAVTRQIINNKDIQERYYNLDKILFLAMNSGLTELLKSYRFIHMDTIEARNYYLAVCNDKV